MQNNTFPKFKKYYDTLSSKFEDYNFSDEEISCIVKNLLSSDSILDNNSISLPEGVALLKASTYLSNLKVLKKEIKIIGSDNIVLVFVESMKEKIEVKKNLPGRFNSYEIVYVPDVGDSNFLVEIESRLNSMMLEPRNICKEEEYPEGNIVLAKLFDLVEIYNKLGDELFEKNVRVSIEKDRNEVGKSIKSTLEEEPYMFQYYNNGITILADKIDLSDNASITLSRSKNDKLSVINGAQTLTACAEFFYDSTKSPESIDAAKNAYVLLRIVRIKSVSDKKDINRIRNIENKISVSLNRQKPITTEDLAMASEIITDINESQINDYIDFNIVRNGEDEDERNIHLYNVAKYILATKLLKPGTARNCYRDTLLKMNGSRFSRVDLWKTIGENKNNFVNHYGLVRLAKKLDSLFIINYDDLSAPEQENVKIALEKSGEYLFISCIVYALFADTSGAISNINILYLEQIYKNISDNIYLYLDAYKKLIVTASHNKKFEYSDMKSDDLFNNLITEDYFKSFCDTIKKSTHE